MNIIIRANSGDEWISDVLVSFSKPLADAQRWKIMLEDFDFDKHPFAEIEVPADFEIEVYGESYGLFPYEDRNTLFAGGYLHLHEAERNKLSPPETKLWKMGGSYIIIKKNGYQIAISEGYGGHRYTTSTL